MSLDLNLGKIAITYRGDWAYNAQYKRGDIVTFGAHEHYRDGTSIGSTSTDFSYSPALFVYVGPDDHKIKTDGGILGGNEYIAIPPPYVQTYSGISTVGINTDIITIDMGVYGDIYPLDDDHNRKNYSTELLSQSINGIDFNDVRSDNRGRFTGLSLSNLHFVEDLNYVYSEHFPSNTKVKEIISLNDTSPFSDPIQYVIKTSKKSINTGIASDTNIVIGSRRVANRYETSINTKFWQPFSEGSSFRGEFDENMAYNVGDIVTKTTLTGIGRTLNEADEEVRSYICISAVAPGNYQPLGVGTCLFRPLIKAVDQQYRQELNTQIGPAWDVKTPDPENDHLGVWATFLNGDRENHQRALMLPNCEPVGWKGHPYINQPEWYGGGVGISSLGDSPTSADDINSKFRSHGFSIRYEWSSILDISITDVPVKCFTYSPDGKYVAFMQHVGGPNYHYLYIIELDRPYNLRIGNKVSYTVSSGFGSLLGDMDIRDMIISPDGKKVILSGPIASGNVNATLHEYELTTGWDASTLNTTPIKTVNQPFTHYNTATVKTCGMYISPNGRYLYLTPGDRQGATIGSVSKAFKRIDLTHPDNISNGGAPWTLPSSFASASITDSTQNADTLLDAYNSGGASTWGTDDRWINTWSNFQFSDDGLSIYLCSNLTDNGNNNVVRRLYLRQSFDITTIEDDYSETNTVPLANHFKIIWSGGGKGNEHVGRVIMTERNTAYTLETSIYNNVWFPSTPDADYTKISFPSKYNGNTPWMLQEDLRNNTNNWRWNTTQSRNGAQRFSDPSFVDNDGNILSIGGGRYASATDGLEAGANTGTYGISRVGEAMAASNTGYYSDSDPSYGNALFGESKTRPRVIQYLRSTLNALILRSNGIVSIAGQTKNVMGQGDSAANSDKSSLSIEIPKRLFKDRSIVKIGAFDDAGNSNNQTFYALDEYGELWSAGYNGTGNLGVGYEPLLPADINYAGISTYHTYGGQSNSINNQDDNTQEFVCIGKEAFGGKRIVDFYVGVSCIWAMDENGDLWSWGENNHCDLGYPTGPDGFVTATNSKRPKLITSPLGYDHASSTGLRSSATIVYSNGSGTGADFTNDGNTGTSFTKTYNHAGYAAFAEDNTGIGYTGAVAISARFENGPNAVSHHAGIGLDNDFNYFNNTTYAYYCAFSWLKHNNDTIYIYENGTNVGQFSGWKPETVVSIVYDPLDGFVNYYIDYDGDGSHKHLVRRVFKTRAGDVANEDTPLYPYGYVYGYGDSIRDIQVTDKIYRRTWQHYGGVQKVVAPRGNMTGNRIGVHVLDGQGYIWNCAGDASTGVLGNGDVYYGDVTTDPWDPTNEKGALQRRKFIGSNSDGSSPRQIGGRVNNFWIAGYRYPFVVLSVRGGTDIGLDSNEVWAYGRNDYYQLTDGTTSSTDKPVQIKGMPIYGVRGGDGNSSSPKNYLMTDIVTVTSTIPADGYYSTANRWTIQFLDKYGQAYSTGRETYCESGTHPHDGSIGNTQISNQLTYNLQLIQSTSPYTATYAWPRVYVPNHLQNKIVDVFGVGDNLDDAANQRQIDDRRVLWLFEDGSILITGNNSSYGYGNRWSWQGPSLVAVPTNLEGFS